MSKIGVQMIHKPCGHSGYHIVEQIKDSRALYEEMEKLPCPDCLAGKLPAITADAVAQDGTLVDFKTVKVPRHRQVTIRRGR